MDSFIANSANHSRMISAMGPGRCGLCQWASTSRNNEIRFDTVSYKASKEKHRTNTSCENQDRHSYSKFIALTKQRHSVRKSCNVGVKKCISDHSFITKSTKKLAMYSRAGESLGNLDPCHLNSSQSKKKHISAHKCK